MPVQTADTATSTVMPVLVRNNKTGPTVFVDKPSDTRIEWAGHGDSAGEDYQAVPRPIVEANPRFMRAVAQGILSIEDEDLAANAQRQAEAYETRTRREAETTQASIDQQTRGNDLLSVECVGPATRGVGRCGADVVVREKNLGNEPPLCPTHKHLSSQYVPADSEEVDATGKPVQGWERMSLGPRQK